MELWSKKPWEFWTVYMSMFEHNKPLPKEHLGEGTLNYKTRKWRRFLTFCQGKHLKQVFEDTLVLKACYREAKIHQIQCTRECFEINLTVVKHLGVFLEMTSKRGKFYFLEVERNLWHEGKGGFQGNAVLWCPPRRAYVEKDRASCHVMPRGEMTTWWGWHWGRC